MKMILRSRIALTGAICVSIAAATFALAQVRQQNWASNPPATSKSDQTAKPSIHRATGTFEVKMTPQATDDYTAAGSALSRFTFDKQFHGDLEATSKGQMLAAGDYASGSAGYVAMERVTGTLSGRSGAFLLQHSATMDHNVPSLSITVVPGSGSGQLAGISGTLNIRIEGGKHFYDFDYVLPDSH
jgi:hypothetical protein